MAIASVLNHHHMCEEILNYFHEPNSTYPKMLTVPIQSFFLTVTFYDTPFPSKPHTHPCFPRQYFEHVEEMEWAIEVCLKSGMPVVASMCIGPQGDLHGVSAGECAVRMAKAGAHVGRCPRLAVHVSRFHSSRSVCDGSEFFHDNAITPLSSVKCRVG